VDTRSLCGRCALRMDSWCLPRTTGALCDGVRVWPLGARAHSQRYRLLKVWSHDGVLLQDFVGHESFVYACAAAPDGMLASGGEDRCVKLWRSTCRPRQCRCTVLISFCQMEPASRPSLFLRHPCGACLSCPMVICLSARAIGLSEFFLQQASGQCRQILRRCASPTHTPTHTLSHSLTHSLSRMQAYDESVRSQSIPRYTRAGSGRGCVLIWGCSRQFGDLSMEKLPDISTLSQPGAIA
jgi:WD40 repeat protein